MLTMNRFIIFTVIAIFLPLACDALKCMSCQQLAGKDCQDPFTQAAADSYSSDCDDDQVCVKMTTVVKIRDSGYIQGWERHSKVVTRYCEAKSGKPDGCRGWQNNGGITIKCFCSTDDCNSGRALSSSIFSILSGIIIAFVGLILRLH
ncbi:hypothetical protein Btru_058003 [Bulinus truncatus]|nr:hypothetical protein Btru_058003 [Bulinus truncatus]